MSLLIHLFTVILIFSTKLLNVVANPSESFSNSDLGLRIVGGEEAKDAQFPYAVGIISINKQIEGMFCGGSLITTTSVLTAGHCLYERVSARVMLGAKNLTNMAVEPKKQTFVCWHFIIHPKYDASKTPNPNDLAIIRLPRPATLNTHVKIILIPVNDKKSYAGIKGTAMGWGRTSSTDTTGHLQCLLYESDTILPNEVCKISEPHLKDTQICQSGKDGKCSYYGDSGGPLVVNNDTLVGVLSFIHPDCEKKQTYGATRVSKYIKWINDNSH